MFFFTTDFVTIIFFYIGHVVEFGRKDRCICGYYGDFMSLGPVLGAHLNISYLVINRRLLEGILDITLSSRKTRGFTARKY